MTAEARCLLCGKLFSEVGVCFASACPLWNVEFYA